MTSAPYITNIDDTRKWVETYRVGNKIKPALIIRSASDSNYINNQFVQLPAYNNKFVFTQSICNIVSPGQRVPGLLSWSVSESLDNITQTATMECLDALPISTIQSTITGFAIGTKGDTTTSIPSLPARWHSHTIRFQWVMDGNGISQKLKGDREIKSFRDPALQLGKTFFESQLQYRVFEPEIIQVQDLSAFPAAACPDTEKDSGKGTVFNEWWDIDTTGSFHGVGAYYILVGNEVMRVTKLDPANNRIYIIPGGRGAAGTIQSHQIGDTVQLLGFRPFSGKWAGFGYLMPQDYKVIQSPMRPGACYVSYEGYGNPGDNVLGLSKTFDRQNNMCFTGYWFVTSPQATLDNSGVPKLTTTLQSCGYIVNEQKITPDALQRSKNMFYSWAKATFDEVGHQRHIPGSWLDFNNWDPLLPGSYPMQIFTEYGQNKAFFDHMNDTDLGKTCEFCQQEWLSYIAQHEHSTPTGSIAEARAVGKHIYKESIEVFSAGGQFNAGPLKTYGRLMTAMAIAAWDNPLEGNELGTRWTKIPNSLFNNMLNWTNGRVWNGQLGFEFHSETPTFDFSNQTHEDKFVYGKRIPLKCPFQSSYDRQPWSQPGLDLADLNKMTFTFTREGFPVFIPVGRILRGLPHPKVAKGLGVSVPTGWFTDGGLTGDRLLDSKLINLKNVKNVKDVSDTDTQHGNWHLAYGGSIDNYTHTIDVSGVLTLVYVSCQTAFSDEITFTIAAAGTGVKESKSRNEKTSAKLVWYSSKVGNKEGLQLTSGVQQVDTVTLDNLLLGLDWNTKPASWGLTVSRDANSLTQVDKQPPIPMPNPNWEIKKGSKDAKHHPKLVTDIQKCINFMLERRYMGPAVFDKGGQKVFGMQINEDGDFGKSTEAGVIDLQNFLTKQNVGYSKVGSGYAYSNPDNGWGPTTWKGHGREVRAEDAGTWSVGLVKAMRSWLKINSEYIKTDVWWYVQNGLPWDQYVGAITGLSIPQRQDTSTGSAWTIDQLALKAEAQDWMKQFFKDAVNYGNQVVDESINKATTKIVQTNMADPRIQLGDVIWATIPGYMSPNDKFGHSQTPIRNGIYVTGITRSMNLQDASYTATYQGYRYTGRFESGVMMNANNYCSSIHNEI